MPPYISLSYRKGNVRERYIEYPNSKYRPVRAGPACLFCYVGTTINLIFKKSSSYLTKTFRENRAAALRNHTAVVHIPRRQRNPSAGDVHCVKIVLPLKQPTACEESRMRDFFERRK